MMSYVYNIDNGMVTFLCLLDYSKAFDTIDRNLLQYYCVEDIALQLFSSYLTQRFQSVKFGSRVTSELQTSFEVSQGSIRRLILFSVFIADLQSVILHDWNVHCYTDYADYAGTRVKSKFGSYNELVQ